MSKQLVAYFSAGGVTARVAEKLASAIQADLFEIVPEVRYTSADLDWRDRNSRSTVEMKDRSSRPAVSSKVEDMSVYDRIFVGFPVWWYREPSIIDTFLEQYDFSGKTIVPFATSGGSDIGDSWKSMQEVAKGATVLKGRRFRPNVSEKELAEWAETL